MQRGVLAGEKLRELRLERGLTQDQAAKLLGWKKHSYLTRYETNSQALGKVVAARIARAYSRPPWPTVTVDDILGEGHEQVTPEQLQRIEALLSENRDLQARIRREVARLVDQIEPTQQRPQRRREAG